MPAGARMRVSSPAVATHPLVAKSGASRPAPSCSLSVGLRPLVDRPPDALDDRLARRAPLRARRSRPSRLTETLLAAQSGAMFSALRMPVVTSNEVSTGRTARGPAAPSNSSASSRGSGRQRWTSSYLDGEGQGAPRWSARSAAQPGQQLLYCRVESRQVAVGAGDEHRSFERAEDALGDVVG